MSDDMQIEKISIENGSLEMKVKGQAMQILAQSFADQFSDNGATNYLEMECQSDSTGPLIITIQRINGLTPAQKAALFEEKAAAFDFISKNCIRDSPNERTGRGSFWFRIDDGSHYMRNVSACENLLEAVNQAIKKED